MCGIAGILNLHHAEPPKRGALAEMASTLQHRGPDGVGFYCDECIGLAHTRLSIIDLEGGNQPIHNENRTVWVVFNGEIFNYIEIREFLEKKGHQFYTRSDTEVIVHLYEEYGDEFVSHLNGQFAIALWDSNKRRFLLVRDRVGIRPIFYTIAKGRLYFSSEIKAMFTQPEIERGISIQGLSEIFRYWAPLEPHTVFEGIKQLPPGNLLSVEKGRMLVSRYWDWSFPEERSHDRHSLEEYAEQLREHLISAVRLRLRADVPVGAYLSGGLDSSIITSLIKNYTDTPLRTFSLEFEDEEFDESKYQTELVRYLKTQHTRILCKKTDIQEVFPRVIWHTESPILRTAPTPLMLLSEEVRRAGYKVVLTGEGSDEVMAGYDIFKEARIRRFWARSPESKLRPRILERLYPYLKYSPTRNAYSQSFFKRGMEYVNDPFFAHVPRWKTTQRTRQFFSESICNELNNHSHFEDIAERLPPQIMNWQPLNRDQYIEAHTLMSGYLLSSQGDRVALANSVEGRFPFLDHKFIEFASKLPIRYKMMGLNEKFLLKKAMQGLLPENIRVRTKQPYRAPDSRSFFSNGKAADYVEDLLSTERIKKVGYFNHKAVTKLVKKCKSEKAIGFADNMAFVGILSTMLVDDMFLSGTVKTEYKNHNSSNIVNNISNNKEYDIGSV